MANKAAPEKTAETPTSRLATAAQSLASAFITRGLKSVSQRLENATERLNDVARGEAEEPPIPKMGGRLAERAESVKEAIGKRSALGGSQELKATNIVEQIDVGVPLRVAYNQWTEFEDFPSFMKKVESVERPSEERLTWRARVLWSRRTWESTITEQVPDDRIIWRSEGPKGYVDGAVTFHELAPGLTRILLVLEYHPQGFFEGVGNLWRAQGRRARLELKHFQRHVMTQAALHPEQIEGWRGEIHDGEVVKTHEQTLEEEAAEEEEPEEEFEEEPEEEEGEEEDEEEEDYARLEKAAKRGRGSAPSRQL